MVFYLQPSLHISTTHCTKNESIVRGCVKNAHLRSKRPSLQGRRRKVGERRQGCVGYFSHQRKLLFTQPLILSCVLICNVSLPTRRKVVGRHKALPFGAARQVKIAHLNATWYESDVGGTLRCMVCARGTISRTGASLIGTNLGVGGKATARVARGQASRLHIFPHAYRADVM